MPAPSLQVLFSVRTSLAKTLYNPDFAKAVPEFEEAAVIVSASFETMGLLVYKKITPFDLVMDLADGMAASMFRKLEKSIIAQRIDQNQPSWAE